MMNTQIEQLTELANQGDADAQYRLAMRYIYGDGVEEDNTRALYLLNCAAGQEHAEAQYNLGVCYHYGYGTEADLERAFEYYKRSPLRGYAKAEVLVGRFYLEGKCVPRDI